MEDSKKRNCKQHLRYYYDGELEEEFYQDYFNFQKNRNSKIRVNCQLEPLNSRYVCLFDTDCGISCITT